MCRYIIATDYYRGDTITGKPVVFLRPTRLTILTGRRQTSWLFMRVTLRSWTWDYGEQIQQAFRAGIELAFPDYNSSAILPPDKKLRGLRNYRAQCVPCEIRARGFSFRHFCCFFPPDFFSDFSHRWSHTLKTHSSVEVLRHGQVWFLAL